MNLDAAVQAAESAWSRCLGRHGFEVASRAELLEEIESAAIAALDEAGSLPAAAYARLLQREKIAYESDQNCGPGLVAATRAALSRFDAEFIAAHVDELAPFHISKYR